MLLTNIHAGGFWTHVVIHIGGPEGEERRTAASKQQLSHYEYHHWQKRAWRTLSNRNNFVSIVKIFFSCMGPLPKGLYSA